MAFIKRIKFLAGHLKGLEYQYLGDDKLRCMNKTFGAPKFYLSEISSMEIASEENVKKLGGTIGGALVGGVLLGGVGAIVGAVGSGQTTETTLILTFKGGEKSLAKANSPVVDAIRAHLFKLEQNPCYADTMPKKMALWKKVCVGVFVLAALGAAFGEKKEARNTEEIGSDPCADIKTMDDWDKASSLWKMSNSECKPMR